MFFMSSRYFMFSQRLMELLSYFANNQPEMNFSSLVQMLLLSYMSLSASSSPTSNIQIECISAPILAPRDDCRAIINNIYAKFGPPGDDQKRTWGRTIAPSIPPDEKKVPLPFGFRLARIAPWMTPNRCELHVDNAIDRLDGKDEFSMMQLAAASVYLLDTCYPQYLTGKVFPAVTRNVYITTLYVGIQNTEEKSNFTMLQEVQLGSELRMGLENLTSL